MPSPAEAREEARAAAKALEALLSGLRTKMSIVEDIICEWSASGQVDGGVAPRPALVTHREAPGMPPEPQIEPDEEDVKAMRILAELEQRTSKAIAARKRNEAATRTARADLAAAKQALVTATELAVSSKKKNKGPDPALIEAVSKFEAELASRQQLVEAARTMVQETTLALTEARVEAEARARRRVAASMDARLRTIHMQVTGRFLPCRLRFLLEKARFAVRTDPMSVRLTSEDVRRLLLALDMIKGRPEDMKSMRSLFAALVREERAAAEASDIPTGADGDVPISARAPSAPRAVTVSLAALRRRCGLEPSLLPRSLGEMPGRHVAASNKAICGDSCGGGSPLPMRKSADEATGKPRPASAAVHRDAPPMRPQQRPASGGPLRPR